MMLCRIIIPHFAFIYNLLVIGFEHEKGLPLRLTLETALMYVIHNLSQPYLEDHYIVNKQEQR